MRDLPQTEAINPRTGGLDELSTEELVRVLAQEQRIAAEAVLAVSDALAKAVKQISTRLRRGGHLHYVGAGSSGRLGFLDASEMPPTFGTERSLVCAHIAGGKDALTHAIEGAEDDADAGLREMRDHVREGDAVVGISASGGAPYVIAALEEARRIGAWTMAVTNNFGSPILAAADLGITLQTGAEALAGSTRLKAGTSQKILLNTLSTAVMVRLGKVHENLMVDVVATNKKLRDRALRLVRQLTGASDDEARALLQGSNGSVKTAVIMFKRSVDAQRARAILESNEGSLRLSLRE